MRYAVALSVMLLWAITPSAQAPAPPPLEEARFDVTSVKPIPPEMNIAGYSPDQTRFHGWMSIRELLNMAFSIQPYRIVELPEWTKTQRFEVTATITAPRQRGDLAVMIRHLLEDRFGVKTHRESRPVPVYILTMSRGDGKPGPKLQRVERDCSMPTENITGCSWSFGIGRFRSSGQGWGHFVSILESNLTGRPVIDKTGLSGQFDIMLEWNPEVSRIPEGISAPPLAELEARPILFTALQEQLGLKLEPSTAPMDVLVVDAVERPKPD